MIYQGAGDLQFSHVRRWHRFDDPLINLSLPSVTFQAGLGRLAAPARARHGLKRYGRSSYFPGSLVQLNSFPARFVAHHYLHVPEEDEARDYLQAVILPKDRMT